jgi:hypothetical protein
VPLARQWLIGQGSLVRYDETGEVSGGRLFKK